MWEFVISYAIGMSDMMSERPHSGKRKFIPLSANAATVQEPQTHCWGTGKTMLGIICSVGKLTQLDEKTDVANAWSLEPFHTL